MMTHTSMYGIHDSTFRLFSDQLHHLTLQQPVMLHWRPQGTPETQYTKVIHKCKKFTKWSTWPFDYTWCELNQSRSRSTLLSTHIVPLIVHALDRGPPHGFQVQPLSRTHVQVELVFSPRYVDVSQVNSAACILPGTQHVGAYRPRTVYRVVALHWGTFKG